MDSLSHFVGDVIMKKRFILNLCMILVLLLLYNTQGIPLMLHEIAGIGVFFLFGIHIAVNHKWKAKSTERAITVLLGISFVVALISGIVISHELFARAVKAPHYWHTIHLSGALLALLLSAAHAIQEPPCHHARPQLGKDAVYHTCDRPYRFFCGSHRNVDRRIWRKRYSEKCAGCSRRL